MTVYVDQIRRYPQSPGGWGHEWCHMMADDEEELHRMAQAIGLKRAWFQPHPTLAHYDLTPNKRAAAIRAGALVEDAATLVRRLRSGQRLQPQMDLGDA